jgi:cellulose synthase/poly-beta-1,6-N-acetylglucosamine synthase-like glycosyltransferase
MILSKEFFLYVFNQTAFAALITFSFVNFSYLILLIWSILYFNKKHIRKPGSKKSFLNHGVSLIVPCFNEAKNIEESLKSFLAIDYPNFEVVIVNDGSKDKTLEIIVNKFKMEKMEYPKNKRYLSATQIHNVYVSTINPNLYLIDKENGGKSDALNVGIDFCSKDYFCAVDGDSILERSSFKKMIKIFNIYPDTIACGSTIGVINGCDVKDGKITKYNIPGQSIEIFQLLEYLRCFFIGRAGWEYMGSNLIISGAFGIFNKDVVKRIGGYSVNNIGEDMDLVVRLHKYMDKRNRAYSIRFVKEPLCWTEVPFDTKSLKRQRSRWHKGLIMSLFDKKDDQLMIKPSKSVLSYLTVPYYIVADIFVPILVVFTYILIPIGLYFGFVSFIHIWLFFLTFLFYSTAMTLSCIFLQEIYYPRELTTRDLLKLTYYAFLENFGYRQMINFFKLIAVYEYMTDQNNWGVIKRKGFEK